MCKYKTLGYTGLFSLHIERPSYFISLCNIQNYHPRGAVDALLPETDAFSKPEDHNEMP